ncbi:MAG: hypothetical protein A4E39_00902 [Methanoregulaceae archaeon PtaB.Bin152]|nr:MAG: hypothetical protein A4E39_00902 [Methanoregulaceae archaeon PtaB.Bin152]
MPSFRCTGKNQTYEASSPNDAELMKEIAEHANTARTMDRIRREMLAGVNAAIKN